MNNLNKLSENKFFIWACAGIVFLGLAALKNDFIFSNSLVSRIADQVQPSIEPQKLQLDPAPKTVKAVYLTGWSAGNPKKIQEIIGLAKTTEINGVVIDVKDYLGKVFFETESELI
ncbi:TPA: hypothetical protein DEX28_00630, partial [Patescibacteria group bacterium]|nr:hypothetical protein [Patescibacteria group bacterium]